MSLDLSAGTERAAPVAEPTRELVADLLGHPIDRTELTPIAPETYGAAIEATVEALCDEPGVIALYGDSGTSVDASISDVDITVVVEDDLEHVDHLHARMAAVIDRYEPVFLHGPVLVPRAVFTELPLMANMSMNLDHLAGERLNTRTPCSRTIQFEFFDRFAFEPYRYLDQQVVPEVVSKGTVGGELRAHLGRVVGPVGSCRLGWSFDADRRLPFDMRVGLSKMQKLRYDLERLQLIDGGDYPEIRSLVDRIDRLRDGALAEPIPDDRYLETIVETLAAFRRIQEAFIARQSIYDPDAATYLLRRACPAIATPRWESLAMHEQLSLFERSGIRGHVLPPVAAMHLASFPRGDELFDGPSPSVRLVDEEAAELLVHRNRALRTYRRFVETVGLEHDVFSLITAFFLRNHATRPPSSVSPHLARVKAGVREHRNRLVARAWLRSDFAPAERLKPAAYT